MPALRTNILANYGGQLWMAIMGLAFLPLYTRILGMEAFGVVGLMLSLQAILQLFDFGIGGAVNRELSRRANNPKLYGSTGNLVRTAEILIWILAVLISVLVWLASQPMADYWLNPQDLNSEEVGTAIAIMGFAIALLWPSTFYANCLSGLERQPTLNLLLGICATLRYAGVVPALLWIEPTIEVFLWWYTGVGFVQSLTMAFAVWRALPHSNLNPHWSASELLGSHKFAGGLFAIGALALATTQIDRIVLASLRPLEELGYYTLALSIAAGLGRMVQPMFTVLYPRFSRLVASQDEKTLVELFHLSSQCLAVIVASVGTVLIVFAPEVLLLWTGDNTIADKTALPMAMLVAGAMLNGLMNIPYALQLANGWTRLALSLNVGSLLLGIPLCLWAVPTYGMAGAALPWLLGNLISVCIGTPIMHRRILSGELARWYLQDNLPPFVTAIVVASLMAALTPQITLSWTGLTSLLIISFTVVVASALSSPACRSIFCQLIARRLSA